MGIILKSKAKQVMPYLVAIVAVVLFLLAAAINVSADSGMYGVGIGKSVEVSGLPTEISVGDSGKVGFKLRTIPGVEAEGTVTYCNKTPEIISIDENGNWKAEKKGTAIIALNVEASDEYFAELQLQNCEESILYGKNGEYRVEVDYAYEPVFRLYNSGNGDHVFTQSAGEKVFLEKAGWTVEDNSFMTPRQDATPVYRIYNPYQGDHFFTVNKAEVNLLIRLGWVNEGTAFYSNTNDGKPIYRLYNPNAAAGTHHYTSYNLERKLLVQNGWIDEGIAWYGESVDYSEQKEPAKVTETDDYIIIDNRP